MTQTLAHRQWLHIPLLATLAGAYGALIASRPLVATALAVVVFTVALAFLAPVAHLGVLLFLTTIVPYSISNRYLGLSVGPGVLLSDLFLLTGLARAAVTLARARLDPRRIAVLCLLVAFSLWTLLAAYTGLLRGHSLSQVGLELRELGGFAAAITAMAVLLDPKSSTRLARVLLMLGLTLGTWGLLQWLGGLRFESAGDFGVRAGVSYAPGARGQVQGGLFAFPIAVIVAAAVLVGGQLRRRTERQAVGAVLALNAISLLLTFERTFWLVTMAGVALVVLRAGRSHRARAALWSVVIAIGALGALAAFSPAILQSASARLLSIGKHGSDNSLRYRRVESEHGAREIREAPLVGSGLGASIWWGRPWDGVPARAETYTHNGYLRLVWRLGLIGAALLLLPLLLAVAGRGAPHGGPTLAAIRVGAQVSLLALMVAAALFPTFTGFGITTAIGVLIAICTMPRTAASAAPVGARAAR